MERLGFGKKARDAIVEEGIDSVSTLLLFRDKDLASILHQLVKITAGRKATERLVIRAVQIKRLIAVRELYRKCKLCNEIIDVNGLNKEVVDEESVKFSNVKKEDLQDDETSINIPKFTGTNWFLFKKTFVNKIGGMCGAAEISLKYVIRENDDPEHDKSYTDEDELLVFTDVLSSQCYDLDNKSYTAILQD